MNAAIAGRVAALHHVLVVAADADPEAAALLATLERQRAHGARAVVSRMAELGGLRPGLDLEQAAAIADLLIDPLPYRRLVQQHGWTPEAYTRVPPTDGGGRAPAVDDDRIRQRGRGSAGARRAVTTG